MFLENLCAPALIYIIFSVVQIAIDTSKGNFNEAFIKLWVALVFTILLNFLCEKGLGVVSWLLVFVPFILMSFVVAVLLFLFGLDPKTRNINIPEKEIPETPDVRQELIAEKKSEADEIAAAVTRAMNKTEEEKQAEIESALAKINNEIQSADVQNTDTNVEAYNNLTDLKTSCNNLQNRELSSSTINACTTLLNEITN